MVYTLDTADHSDAAIGALADCAERVGWTELSFALRAELIQRERSRSVPVPEAEEA